VFQERMESHSNEVMKLHTVTQMLVIRTPKKRQTSL
jgi:hypothetical protein